MDNLEWYEAVEVVKPYIFKISTPEGSGTGFLINNTKNHTMCAIATAAHVIEHSHYWEEPIRIEHFATEKNKLLRSSERAIKIDVKRDTAAIIFTPEDLDLPIKMLTKAPENKYLKVGNEIGWLGFPAISGSNLCFFSGMISAWVKNEKAQSVDAYLVDGVAINGVSGGPAFNTVGDLVYLIGVVSDYVPNRVTGETLPGLSIVRDVTQFHELARTFASLDEAKSKETTPELPPPTANKD